MGQAVYQTREEDFQVLAGSAGFLLAAYSVGKDQSQGLADWFCCLGAWSQDVLGSATFKPLALAASSLPECAARSLAACVRRAARRRG